MLLIKIKNELGKDFDTNKELKTVAKEKLDINSQELENLLHFLDIYPEIYMIGYQIAIELYMLYQQDKQAALDMLRRIISMRKMSDKQYYNNIGKLGIIPNASLNEFIDKLKEKEKNCLEKEMLNKANISFSLLFYCN